MLKQKVTVDKQLADIVRKLAALPDQADMPASATQRDLATVQEQKRALERRLVAAREALATLAAHATAADEDWLAYLNAWHFVLVDELESLPAARTDGALGQRINLELSIRVIDHGPDAPKDSGYELSTLRLGELMRDAGYEAIGADAGRNFAGMMPWFGSRREVEQRIATVKERRRIAQAALDDALLNDAEREVKEREAGKLRDAFNSLRVKHGENGDLRVVDRNNELIDESTLTELQRRALEEARRVEEARIVELRVGRDARAGVIPPWFQ